MRLSDKLAHKEVKPQPLKNNKIKVTAEMVKKQFIEELKNPHLKYLKEKEMQYLFPDRWCSRLFVALCRKYKMDPYRYSGQRYTTVVIKGSQDFMDRVVWVEYRALADALVEYLDEVTGKIIREEIHSNTADVKQLPMRPNEEWLS